MSRQKVALDQLKTTGATTGQVPVFNGTELAYGSTASADIVLDVVTVDTNAVATFTYGINTSGQAYYDTAGAVPGQEAALVLSGGRIYAQSITV